MIPRVMSTQHPDNVAIPFFASAPTMGGDDEVVEAFYAFSVLGIDEQMWDFEGKEVDEFVVKKLFERYPDFFRESRLGRMLRLTPRVPNPSVERAEAKLLLETLETIPRSADYARLFYGEDVAPISEVILPMTTSSAELNRVYHLYRHYIVGRQYKRVHDVKLYEWIGRFYPEEISVIPLFETKEAILSAARIVEEYMVGKELEHLRVFLARSDPAMNYGLISAVIYDKYALYMLQELSERESVEIYPILGIGGAPFRGGFTPENVDAVLNEYPSVQTYTVQSSFKYDRTPREVTGAIERIKGSKRGRAVHVPEEAFGVLEKYVKRYSVELRALAPFIREVAKHVPSRRRRKLHIGLFGYSREVNGAALPRAIKFTAALYSIGIPPELLGLSALSEVELDSLSEFYRGLYDDIAFAFRYFNPLVVERFPFLKPLLGMAGDYERDGEHEVMTARVLNGGADGSLIIGAARVRGFLG